MTRRRGVFSNSLAVAIRNDSIRRADTVAFDEDLVSHLEQRGVGLLDRLNRSVTPAYFDHPGVGVFLDQKARLGDGCNKGIISREWRLSAQRALYLSRRRRLVRARVAYGEHRTAVRLIAGAQGRGASRLRQHFAVTIGSKFLRPTQTPADCYRDYRQKD